MNQNSGEKDREKHSDKLMWKVYIKLIVKKIWVFKENFYLKIHVKSTWRIYLSLGGNDASGYGFLCSGNYVSWL